MIKTWIVFMLPKLRLLVDKLDPISGADIVMFSLLLFALKPIVLTFFPINTLWGELFNLTYDIHTHYFLTLGVVLYFIRRYVSVTTKRG